MTINDQIRSHALSLGFSNCGFARAEPLESLRSFYETFLAERDFSGMNYLERFTEQRLHPELLLPGVQSVIAVLMNYYPEERLPEENNFILSKYAYGRGYQKVMKERLAKLVTWLDTTSHESRSLAYADSGPVLEKLWAQRSGLGWQGKHTILINETDGSFFFIGIILTTLILEPDNPARDRCGNCTRCLDACPTNALHTPYRLDINRCLTFHTNTNKGEIPDAVKGKFRDRIFGCDVCQDACPFNRAPKPTREPVFRILPGLSDLRKPQWKSLSEEEFNRIFEHSEIKHTGYKTIKRNMGLAGGE
ncbi:MAG: tRNA epoxyqueuosine(34) reductase QueG [Bacteroidales bacterium]|nr:tRNA epoxyqueuosine(34) reductase QueG [Bacteroidales bacterium]